MILSFEFSSAHFYKQNKWSNKKNQAVFGLCYTEHGHGHNYRLELEIDISDKNASQAAKTCRRHVKPVIDQLDHQHLNFKVPFFKETVPTTENISLYLKDQITLPKAFKLKLIRLFEMDTIFVELPV